MTPFWNFLEMFSVLLKVGFSHPAMKSGWDERSNWDSLSLQREKSDEQAVWNIYDTAVVFGKSPFKQISQLREAIAQKTFLPIVYY